MSRYQYFAILSELAPWSGNEASEIVEGVADAEARDLREDAFASPDRTAVVPDGGGQVWDRPPGGNIFMVSIWSSRGQVIL
jgi:hypothetical protein